MSSTKYKILLALFAISFIASAVLSFIPLEQACGGTDTTCYVVQTSNYEEVLGIKNAYFGLVAFFIMGILAFLQIKNPNDKRRNWITYGLIFASLVAIYFLYIQFFALNALCKYCMVVDGATLISLGIVLFWKER